MNDSAQMDRLCTWLEPVLGGPVTVELHDGPGSGFSADNVVFTATVGERITKHVLRRETGNESPYPEQAPGVGTGVFVQSSVMRALRGIVPVATGVGVETDASVLGVPFLVMDFVEGVVPIEYPACTIEGFFTDGTPALRSTMITRGLEELARLHTTPWRDVGLSFLRDNAHPPGAARQLQLWESQLRTGLQGRRADVFERAADALQSALPEPPPADDVVLVWGDARLGNIMWDPATGEPLCVTDFEGVALGERQLDLGWWLMADRWMHEGSDAARLDGEPTRAEQVEIYEQAAGVRAGELRWYELFAAYRFATSVVRVMNRWVLAGDLPADHTVWRDNPATALVAAILDEPAAVSS